jgi:putative OPT family oligopeptide transporter
MAAPTLKDNNIGDEPPKEFQPYAPANVTMPEFTFGPLLVGAVLGIVFGASSLYLLLKVGMTVSASVPIAVLSITLFRVFSRSFGFRRATILENNIVQTAGSAGESIAFGVGVTMPALLLLGFEMEVTRVMTVSVLGGLLGILMMIPLRRAFIVKQHGKLAYPEGTACAEVLVAGEKGGMTAKMVFVGFGIALVHKFLTAASKLWSDTPSTRLYETAADGTKTGLKGAGLSGELAPELLGVGYIIGPRIASLMMAGAMLSYFVMGPAIAHFGDKLNEPVKPAKSEIDKESKKDKGLIGNMTPKAIRTNYLLNIGAGAVAAGGIISMLRAMPLIFGSILSGVRDLRASRAAGKEVAARTDRDLSMNVVLFGSLGLVLILMLIPSLGLGVSFQGLLGAVMVLLFGFLFVTVSSRLTGEVGSSSNPISGMTIATLLMTCLIFWLVGMTNHADMLTALSVAAVVCIASSNGGTTSQDLKTGFLVGATPRYQQLSILVGALTSALVIGLTMLALNAVGTHYTSQDLPQTKIDIPEDAPRERPGKPYDRTFPTNKGLPTRTLKVPSDAPRETIGKPYQNKEIEYRVVDVPPGEYPDVKPGRYFVNDKGRIKWRDLQNTNEYYVVHVREDEYPGVKPGRYLVDESGRLQYRTDIPIKRIAETMDNGQDAPKGFDAPQPELFSNIIKGILGGTLEWSLIIIGVLIAITLELAGVSALPVAVGMYIPLSSTTPIFVGGLIRWLTDRGRAKSSETETETSPGVLLASGYIAGGTLCGLIIAFFAVLPDAFNDALNLGQYLGPEWNLKDEENNYPKVAALIAFALLATILFMVGRQKSPPIEPDIPPNDLPPPSA